jgi:hypothetical protein
MLTCKTAEENHVSTRHRQTKKLFAERNTDWLRFWSGLEDDLLPHNSSHHQARRLRADAHGGLRAVAATLLRHEIGILQLDGRSLQKVRTNLHLSVTTLITNHM